MFSEKFDALMNIAEITNSKLGREVHINPSHIGRLRSGTRPLPKKHDFLPSICRYLAQHIKKDYQINALQKLTGIGNPSLDSVEGCALYLEHWLLKNEEEEVSLAAGRFLSGLSGFSLRPQTVPQNPANPVSEFSVKYASYFYGNAGKRKAVLQFFSAILQAEKPQTLLLFSDENMDWLYEDAAFAARWAELFTKVILKGNRVKIIHTVSRNLNEMLEAIMKWIPIYMTGSIEPYYYPRLRDGIFHRTIFLAPETAAVLSSSVQQNTDGMLNLFITDRAALKAVGLEFNHYFSLCRPLMHIYTGQKEQLYEEAAANLAETEENVFLCTALPPLFTMPENLINELSKQKGNEDLPVKWAHSRKVFERVIKNQHITLVLLKPESDMLTADKLLIPTGKLTGESKISYTKNQYLEHLRFLREMEKSCNNLQLSFTGSLDFDTLLYVKENTGVILVRINAPETAFFINERNMISAFTDYVKLNI